AGQAIALTSACPREGKTMLTLSLAMALNAMKDQRAVILDCDLRRSRIAELLNLSQGVALDSILLGQTCPLDAVRVDERFGLHVIPVVYRDAYSPDHLSRSAFAEIIRELKTRYDYVLVDTPPVLAVADTGLLASHCDQTYMVVRWRKTRHAQIRDVFERLYDLDINVTGTILNFVNPKKEANYRGIPYASYNEYRHV
ncbi:hypothetical protein LCGC14_2771170, partial [marine sediment metagenome]